MSAIIIEDRIRIPVPEAVDSLESFRQWARSDEFPASGRYSFFNSEIWVDMSPERLFTHNQVKGEFAVVLGSLAKSTRLGRYFHDRTLLSHPGAGLSTEPDGLFVARNSFRTGRVRLVQNVSESVELEGAPDMVLEVVSGTSERKDNTVLRDLYWQAGVAEYWLADARGAEPAFVILHRTPGGYEPSGPSGDWQRSAVFGRAFRLTAQEDELGYPEYILSIR